MGEVVKCGFIADTAILDTLESVQCDPLNPTSDGFRELVERAIQVKIDVVVGDLKETGGSDGHPGREILNYGHTMAHAIERATDYQVRHGEAVALGMVYVAELARLAGRLDDRVAAMHGSPRHGGTPHPLGRRSVRRAAGHDAGGQEVPGRDQLRFVVLDGLARRPSSRVLTSRCCARRTTD